MYMSQPVGNVIDYGLVEEFSFFFFLGTDDRQ